VTYEQSLSEDTIKERPLANRKAKEMGIGDLAVQSEPACDVPLPDVCAN
jgi:hypothetical protein